jgi:SAM-dependent methyltransferase
MVLVDYYGELCTKVYESDKSLAGERELEFYLSFVKDKTMKVLEPMCGNGRMLIPFMEKGVDIEGFDISEEMLKVCRQKAEQLNLMPTVFCEKIEDFKSDKKYDLILIPFGSFSLLPDELADRGLDNLKAVLKDEGKILLTTITRYNGIEDIPEWVESNRKQLDQDTIVEYKKVHFDENNSLLNMRLKYESFLGDKLEKTEIMDFTMRLYYPGEFDNILKSKGCTNIVVHEVKDGYGPGTLFRVFECSK